MTDKLAIPDQNAWVSWHPAELRARLSGISQPWCVVGGWALDLWHGYQTREHDDLEFTVLREDLRAFRQKLDDLQLYTANNGTVKALPADREPGPGIFQIWCFDGNAECWRADMMIEPGTVDTWSYKRATEIERPRIEMTLMTCDGIPHLNPAAVLLFKAKHQRPKDEEDFERAFPKLAPTDRRWLRTCLDRLHPGHDWALRL